MQLDAFAKMLTEPTWAAITRELGDDPTIRAVRQQLAHHGWCDLFVCMVRAIEKWKKVLNLVPGIVKKIVKMMLKSSMQRKRPNLDERIIEVVVDKVWTTVKTAIYAKVPVLPAITSEDAVRMLRILAVFACPAPEAHEEVRVHAMEPLTKDARVVLSDEIKSKLREVFGWPVIQAGTESGVSVGLG